MISRKISYAADEIASHYNDLEWWRTRVQQRVNGTAQQYVRGYGGLDVMDADWDTLCIFDACRADLFEEQWHPPGEASGNSIFPLADYSRVTSKGSWTVEWAKRNFTETYGDTVYVTANPLVSRHVPDRWHQLIEVWRDGFDDGIQSVPPEAVTEKAIQAHRDHPNKRVIVHYVQPHAPFIEIDDLQFGAFGDLEEWDDDRNLQAKNVWEALRKGLVTREEVEDAYASNLHTLYEPVSELVNDVDGKVVLSSDHGNEYGRLSWPVPIRSYGHPPNQRQSGLITVPWAEMSCDSRREITTGAVESASERDDDQMESQLQALGYVE